MCPLDFESRYYFSHDGGHWTRRPDKDAPLNCVFGNGVFAGPKWNGHTLRSTDGVQWTQVLKGGHHVEALAAKA